MKIINQMRTRLLTPCISIAIGVSSLLGNTSAMSAEVNVNGTEHGYGLVLDAPFETAQDGMPTTVNAWLGDNNLGGSGDHNPDLPGQVPDDPPNDVPRNVPDIPDNDLGDSNDGMGTLLRDLLDTDEPLRSVIEGWQEEHHIGPFNIHADTEDTTVLELTTSSITIVAAPSAVPVVSAVPVPAAIWLFGSGLLGLIGFARRKQSV